MPESEKRKAQEIEDMEKDEPSGPSEVKAEWSFERDDVSATEDASQEHSTAC